MSLAKDLLSNAGYTKNWPPFCIRPLLISAGRLFLCTPTQTVTSLELNLQKIIVNQLQNLFYILT